MPRAVHGVRVRGWEVSVFSLQIGWGGGGGWGEGWQVYTNSLHDIDESEMFSDLKFPSGEAGPLCVHTLLVPRPLEITLSLKTFVATALFTDWEKLPFC